jgi:Leucine-rich repeat (LRR) protein
VTTFENYFDYFFSLSQELPFLRELFLNENQIVEIQYGAFHRTPNLKIVHLESNFLRKVHPESFLQASGSGVEMMHIQQNHISRIEEMRSLLDALPMLRFLDLSNNKLEEIPFGALRGHGTLEQLHLNNNRLRVIDRDGFMAMPGLRELRLKNNSLSDVLPMPFWNLPNLKGLDLSENNFRKVSPNLLLGLPSLRRLDMSNNFLNMIEPTALINTRLLETVNISHNEIGLIHPATFRHLDRLFEIDAGHNKLIEVIPGLPGAVERVTMSMNRIQHLPHSPNKDMNLPNLRMLNLAGNTLMVSY